MNWYYVYQGQQAGPVDDARLDELRGNGTIQPDTLVWREGMPNWLPYSQAYGGAAAPVPPTAPAPVADVPGQERCVECGRTFPSDEMIQYGDARICAGCKPVFMQKISEGVMAGAQRGRRSLPVDPDQLIEEIRSRDYDVKIGEYLSRGWEVLKANYWLSVGATFLVMLCSQAAGSIPFLGIVLGIILQGPLMGGLNLFFVKLVRGEGPGLAEAFSGFSRHFWRLAGTMVLMMIFIYGWFLPVLAWVITSEVSGNSGEFITNPGFWIIVVVGMLGAIYTAIALIFGMFLSADLELGPWQSLRVSWRVVSRRWFSIFALVFVAGVLSALGILGCIIGVIFTMPILYAVTACAYDDIFGVGPART